MLYTENILQISFPFLLLHHRIAPPPSPPPPGSAGGAHPPRVLSGRPRLRVVLGVRVVLGGGSGVEVTSVDLLDEVEGGSGVRRGGGEGEGAGRERTACSVDRDKGIIVILPVPLTRLPFKNNFVITRGQSIGF